MTRDERLELIAELQADNAATVAEMAARRWRRADAPEYLAELAAEADASSEWRRRWHDALSALDDRPEPEPLSQPRACGRAHQTPPQEADALVSELRALRTEIEKLRKQRQRDEFPLILRRQLRAGGDGA